MSIYWLQFVLKLMDVEFKPRVLPNTDAHEQTHALMRMYDSRPIQMPAPAPKPHPTQT